MRRYKIIIKEEKNTGINFFQRYLTVWVFLCMIVGVLLGHFAPALPAFSNKFEYARMLWSSFFVTFVAKKFIGLLLG